MYYGQGEEWTSVVYTVELSETKTKVIGWNKDWTPGPELCTPGLHGSPQWDKELDHPGSHWI